jgi:hypothetical protein
MGVSRFFHVEPKSYELAHYVNELRIIERGKKHMSHVTMGLATARWCHDILLEFATLPPDQNAFRSFREGNKVFVIQKQRNGKGRFASVTVLGETKDRGFVIIPEGRDAGGWRGFSKEINGVLTPAVPTLKHQREQSPPPAVSGAQRSSNSNGDSRLFKEVVIFGDAIPKFSHVNAGLPEESRNCSNSDYVEILLKVIVNCGPDNKWAVKWAGVLDNPSDPVLSHNSVESKSANIGPSEIIKSDGDDRPTTLNLAAKPSSNIEPKVNHAHKPVTKPKFTKNAPKFIWRPRSGFQQQCAGETSGIRDADHVSVHSEESESQLSDSQLSGSQFSDSELSIEPISQFPTTTEGFQGTDAVSREAEDWILQLRDGGSVRLPPEFVGSHRGRSEFAIPPFRVGETIAQFGDSLTLVMEADGSVRQLVDNHTVRMGSELGGKELATLEDMESENWEDRSLGDDDDEGHWEVKGDELLVNPVHSGEAILSWDSDEAPLEVVPLARIEASYSPEQAKGLVVTEDEKKKQKSAWLLHNLKAVGKVLGAYYEGFEDRVERLLLDIEERRNQRINDHLEVKKGKRSGPRLSRELKNLNSSINYEGNSASKRSVARDRVVSVYQ